MDLDNIIPKSGEWKVVNDRAFKRNIAWLPIFEIEENLIHIFLDVRSSKDILKLVSNLKKTNIEFYFISPLLANPGFKTHNYNALNIENHLHAFSCPQFYDGFQKIDYDFIGNLIQYCRKEKCADLIKDIYDKVNKKVTQQEWDFYSGKKYWVNNREDIRETFRTLYREIQLQQILI